MEFDEQQLRSISIPDSINRIGRYAFSGGCISLTSITVPDSVNSIGEGAFASCDGLTSISLPFVGTSATSSGKNSSVFGFVFATYSSAGSRKIEQHYAEYASSYTTYYIPSGLKSVSITSATQIPFGAFYGCSDLTNIHLPESVTTIGGYAFYGCSGLSDVLIPKYVSGIGNRTFAGCTGFTTITVPEYVTSLGEGAFINCSGLTNVALPEDLITIGRSAFENCSNLSSINIPGSVTNFGVGSFAKCTTLASVIVGNGMTSISDGAFQNCSNLSSIAIPESVTEIRSYAFSNCNKLSLINYEGTEEQWSVISIGGNNSSLENAIKYFDHYYHSLAFQESVEATCTEPGNSAYWKCAACNKYFSDADGKTEVEENSWIIQSTGHSWNTPIYVWADDNLTVTATRTCKNGDHPETESVTVNRELVTAPTDKEAGVYQIVSKGFDNSVFEVQTKDNLPIPALETLKVVKLPAFLKLIETEALESIAAEAIIVPDGCTTIETKAFINCKNLCYIRIPAGIEIPEDAFYGCPNVVIDQR